MSDILQVVHIYRDQLKAEIAKVEAFLHFAADFKRMSLPQPYRPLSLPSPAAIRREPRAEAPPRPQVNGAGTTLAEADSASRNNRSVSLFRGAFAPCALDQRKIADSTAG